MLKEGTLEYEEGRKNTISKTMVKWNTLYISSRVFKIMLMVGAKIIRTCLMWFQRYRENIQDDYIINRGG